MPTQTEYIRWISRALADNPRLTQAGLARAIGKPRSTISMMLSGRRRIQLDEIPTMAVYLGVNPPEASPSDNQSVQVPVMGRITRGDWTSHFEPLRSDQVMALPIEPYPASAQVAFEVAPHISAAVPRLGDYAICVPMRDYRKFPQPNDLVVYRVENDGLVHWGVARVVRRSHTTVLIPAASDEASATIIHADASDCWYVIGSMTIFAG